MQLEQELARLQELLDSEKIGHGAALAEVGQVKERLQSVLAEKQRMENALATAASSNMVMAQLQERIQQLSEANTALQLQLDTSSHQRTQEMQTQRAQLQATIDQLRASYDSATAQMSDLKTSLAVQTGRAEQLKDELSSLQQSTAGLQTEAKDFLVLLRAAEDKERAAAAAVLTLQSELQLVSVATRNIKLFAHYMFFHISVHTRTPDIHTYTYRHTHIISHTHTHTFTYPQFAYKNDAHSQLSSFFLHTPHSSSPSSRRRVSKRRCSTASCKSRRHCCSKRERRKKS